MRLYFGLLFLDIELSGGTGFDLLNKLEFKGKVIFQTAYNEYACRAFEINALYYLLKPITKERLKKVIDNFTNSSNEDIEHNNPKFRYDDRIMIEQKKSIYFIVTKQSEVRRPKSEVRAHLLLPINGFKKLNFLIK